MGFFSDICPECGNKVSKKARFCSKCGRGAPKGWVTCPSCRKWVGNDSKFCPHCNTPLHPEERIDLAGGVWDRKAGLFAQRVDLTDVTGIAKSGLVIQPGTLAILLDAGRKSAILGPGRHTVEGTLRNINWFGKPPPRSVVMVDAGDCIFRTDFKGMRTAEELPIDVVAEITLRFDSGNADGFLENLFKDNLIKRVDVDSRVEVKDDRVVASANVNAYDLRAIDAEAVGNWLKEEATAAVKDICLQSTVEDLVKDPERRPRFEDAIGRALKELLKRSGLELVRVGYVDFISSDYEEMRQKYADLDVKRRQLEYDRKMLELKKGQNEKDLAFIAEKRDKAYRENVIESENMRKAARLEYDDAEFLAQLAQEKGLSDESRRAELEIAKEAASGKIDAKKAEELLAKMARDHEIEFNELKHQEAVELDKAKHGVQINDIKRSETLKDAQTAEAMKRGEIDTGNYRAKTAQELAQSAAENNIKNLERLAKIDAEEMRSTADAVKGLTAEEMAAVVKDPTRLNGIVEIAKAKIDAERDKAVAEKDQKERLYQELKAMMADRAAHDEKLMGMLHDVAAKAVEKAAAVSAPAVNIVK